jgi:pimeloyl-ACP methyl ester carboxylesterase
VSEAEFRRVQLEIAGGVVAGIGFGPELANPDLVFLHATGFNARAYRGLLAPLGERFSVLALDFRGHGRTTLRPYRFGYTSFGRHRDDVIAVLQKHASAPVALAGHSLGATVSLLVAAKRPDLVSSLALIEPVILPGLLRFLLCLPAGPLLARALLPIAINAARRSNRFPSRELALKAFTGRGIFKAFTPEMIEDYLADGLVEDGKGRFKLACTPDYEAATFCAQRHDPWAALRRVRCPLVALRAEKHATSAKDALRRIALIKPDARVAMVEGAGHMLPMERADRVRAAIETAMMLGRSEGLA